MNRYTLEARMQPPHIHTRIVTLGLFAVLACLFWVSKADAGYYGPGRPFGDVELAALAQAEAYWGQQPALCTSRTMEVVAPGALGVDEQGGDVGGRATQPDVPTPCTMWIEEDEIGDLCWLVRHEYGHWLGFGHEDPEMSTLPLCESASPAIPPEVRRHIWAKWRHVRASCPRLPSRARQRCYLLAIALNQRATERLNALTS